MRRLVPSNARYEIKFIATEAEKHQLARWLKLHPAHFNIPYPDRWVNNVYFDTYNHFAYSENLSGSSYRTKLRYRWYGEHKKIGPGILEVKFKRNYFGWKKRFGVTNSPCNGCADWFDIRQNLISQTDAEAKQWLQSNPNPTIINRYYRQYYVTHDNKVRVTIDTRQRVFDQRYKPYPNMTNHANIPGTLVMEFKFDRRDRYVASQIMQGLPLRVSRNSKYMIGVKATHGF